MKLTDKDAKKLMKRADCLELDDSIRNMVQEEFEESGISELQFVKDEINYIIEMYEEDGTLLSGDLEQAKIIIKETKNGKTMPFLIPSLQPKYKVYQVENAKRTLREYRRLKRLQRTF